MRRALSAISASLTLALLFAGSASHAGAPTSADQEGAQVAVFGFVRDSRGSPINGAVVTADFKLQKVKIVGRSDVTGAYAIYKLGEDDNSDASITCVKDGFRFVKEVPRHAEVKANQPSEIDCVLAPK